MREVLGCIWANIAPSGSITGIGAYFAGLNDPTGVAKFRARLGPKDQDFEIDGAAGEHISEVRISSAYSQRAVQVRFHYPLLLGVLPDSNSSRRISAGRSVLEREEARNGQFSVHLKARL